jgi:hypothetical protein
MPLERDQLRRQVGNPIDKSGDDLFLRTLADMGGTDCRDLPMFFPPLSDQRAYADDRVIDKLGKLVAHLGAHFIVGLADEPLGCSKTAEVGNGLDVPDDDAGGHVAENRENGLRSSGRACTFEYFKRRPSAIELLRLAGAV